MSNSANSSDRSFTDRPFADRLADAVRQKKTPTLVGLDPRLASLPSGLANGVQSDDWQAIATAYVEFCKGIIDVVAPLVPAVKPQAAFFEQIGPAGTQALYDVVQYASTKGLVTVMDAKRGDIGSTATAYAAAYLGREGASAWGADCLTVSPYLGDDSLEPFVEATAKNNAGIFVLVKTSNPGGKFLQDLEVGGQTIYGRMAAHVESLSANSGSECGYGAVGAVVGATYPEQLSSLRSAMPSCWLLVPGFGAQGGSAADVAGGFDESGLGAIINSSRGIIFAHSNDKYKDKYGDANWQGAVEAATHDMIAQLADATPAGKLRD